MHSTQTFYVCRPVASGDMDVLCLACADGFLSRECYLIFEHTAAWEAFICESCFGHLKRGGLEALSARLQQNCALYLGKARILQRNLGKFNACDGVKIVELANESLRIPRGGREN